MATKPSFAHYDLKLVNPNWSDPIINQIMELEHFRRRSIYGSARPFIFFQLKEIFHTLESFGSARIEGNNTTLSALIESKIDGDANSSDHGIREIENMEKAMEFIDRTIKHHDINRAYICELHKIVTKGLPIPSQQNPRGEGDKTPGEYRSEDILISGSSHIPPSHTTVPQYMEELIAFIKNNDGGSKDDLLKTAISHHRFMWIHPFRNGNGRTGRLFTYALMVKQGFTLNSYDTYIINPTAIFCIDRKKYYQNLALADSGTDENILKWCKYVLKGLDVEIKKVDKLLDIAYLRKEIIIPAIEYVHERKIITDIETKILKVSISNEEQLFKSKDIKSILPDRSPSERSRIIGSLLEKKMIEPVKENARYYYIHFSNNYLLRGIAKMLQEKDFIPSEY